MQRLAFPSRSSVFFSLKNPNQIIVPTSSNRHRHLPIEFFTRTRLACLRQTSQSTPEIYGSWKVELMFIFYFKLLNVTQSGRSGSACRDRLKQGLHEPCTICPRHNARQRLWSMCDLSGRCTHLALRVRTCAAPRVPGLSVPDSRPISLHAYFMSPN